MPKLPHLSGSDIVRALERLGFVQARQKGSHVVLKRGSIGCVVPMHREVKIGTLEVPRGLRMGFVLHDDDDGQQRLDPPACG